MLSSKFVLCVSNLPKSYTLFSIRNLASETRSAGFRRAFREKYVHGNTTVTIPTLTDTPLRIGRGLLAGASALGLGALGYYGLGLSNQVGILDRSAMWPEYVRNRIRNTYTYVAGGLAITALSAVAVATTPALANIFMRNSLLAIIASYAAVIGSGVLVQSIPYQDGHLTSKHLAWALHAGILGAFVAPLAFLGGPLLMKAAWYTAGVVGGLSIIAATAPSEKFLNMTAPLSIGLGVVFASSIAGIFLPPTTRLGLSLYSISIYGGLVLFSMFLLYDTQKIVHRAETVPYYDPVNNSISIYLDVLNIFIRIAMIMGGGNQRRR